MNITEKQKALREGTENTFCHWCPLLECDEPCERPMQFRTQHLAEFSEQGCVLKMEGHIVVEGLDFYGTAPLQ